MLKGERDRDVKNDQVGQRNAYPRPLRLMPESKHKKGSKNVIQANENSQKVSKCTAQGAREDWPKGVAPKEYLVIAIPRDSNFE